MAPPLWAYQVDNFDPPPDEELVCSICRGVFCEPVQCPCNHVFCRVCISKWLQATRNCPICRKRATRYSIQDVVPLVKNMILKLSLRCRNSENGCEEKFSLEGCEMHMKDCVFEMVQCKNKPCKQKCFRKDIKEHEMNNCPHRCIKCKVCTLKISSFSPSNHNCVKSLRRMVKKKDAIIKIKEEEIQTLQRQINILNEQSRRFSDVSSLASLSTADVIVHLGDMPRTLPPENRMMYGAQFSSLSDEDHNPITSLVSDDNDVEDDGDLQMSVTHDSLNITAEGSLSTEFRSGTESRNGIFDYFDPDNIDLVQSSTPDEANRSSDVGFRNNGRSSTPREIPRLPNLKFLRTSSRPQSALADYLDGIEEMYRSSARAAIAEPDSSITETAESASGETLQPRRPTKRRHPLHTLCTPGENNNGEQDEREPLPYPKRCWRLVRETPSQSSGESSSFSSARPNDAYMEAGPSFASSSVDSSNRLSVITSALNAKSKEGKHLNGESSKSGISSAPSTSKGTPTALPGAVFEKTIALLEQYNLESDPEWLPKFASHGGNDTTSDSEGSDHYVYTNSISSDESSRSESDSSDDSGPEISTAELLAGCFEGDFSDDDDDPEWQPI